VETSTYVTAMAMLALLPDNQGVERATGWLLAQTGQESSRLHRLRSFLLGDGTTVAAHEGWPWYPGAAAWVTPTALTIIALAKAAKIHPNPRLEKRLQSGHGFLWSRACRDGGWNHGSSKALGYEAESYPETTGLALLALRGSPSPRLASALASARRHAGVCRSAEGAAWLRLGLRAHSAEPAASSERQFRCFTAVDYALTMLASQPADNHPLLA
jgi:hypothetical protein